MSVSDTPFERVAVESIDPDALKNFVGSILVDFDHTLLGANSTELFLEAARPRFIVRPVVLGLRLLSPWKLSRRLRSARFGDYLACLFVIVLTPWNLLAWRHRASEAFRHFESAPLAALLRGVDRSRLVIVTFGVGVIVRAMLRDTIWANTQVIATPILPRLSFFLKGKLSMAQGSLSSERVASAALITDSLEDLDLLHKVRLGYLIYPQSSQSASPETFYLPLYYTFRAKYPRGYFLDQTLFVDMLIPIVAVGKNLHLLMIAAVSVPFFVLSFLCVYEIGYLENDLVAPSKETSPTLKAEVERFRSYPIVPNAWLWAGAFAISGLLGIEALDRSAATALLTKAALWSTALLVTRFVFHYYNRLTPDLRTAPYILLQVLKYGSIAILFTPTIYGSLLISSQLLAMSFVYAVYRLGGDRKKVEKERARLAIFMVLTGLTWMSDSPGLRHETFSGCLCAIYAVTRLAKPITQALAKKRTV